MAQIIAGIVMMVLQLLGDIGSKKTGGFIYFQDITNIRLLLFDLFGFIGYAWIGIIGSILLIVGIRKFVNNKNAHTTDSQEQVDYEKKDQEMRTWHDDHQWK